MPGICAATWAISYHSFGTWLAGFGGHVEGGGWGDAKNTASLGLSRKARSSCGLLKRKMKPEPSEAVSAWASSVWLRLNVVRQVRAPPARVSLCQPD